jgi:hypothetical protein
MKNSIPFFVLLFLACGQNSGPKIQPDVDRFFQVYRTFILLSQEDSTGFVDKSALMDSALALHEMAPAEFDTTLSYLEKHPEIFLQAFEAFDDSLRTDMQIRVPE